MEGEGHSDDLRGIERKHRQIFAAEDAGGGEKMTDKEREKRRKREQEKSKG